jgi:SAM-dependent methyltransferase
MPDAQNIYDTPSFFSAYATLPRSQHGLAGAPEWPTLRTMLGDLQNKRFLDLGCGYGWYCRYAVSAGARSVKGVEISERMLGRARELDRELELQEEAERGEPRERADQGRKVLVEYIHANLETVDLEPSSADVVFSSLTLHYLPTPSLSQLLTQIHSALTDKGILVFSVEHPIAMAPIDPPAEWQYTRTATTINAVDSDTKTSAGADTDSNPEAQSATRNFRYWPLNAYSKEGPRVVDWLAPGVVKYHRTVETWINMLLVKGFVIEGFRESWDGMAADTGERERPYYLLVKVRKE